MRLFRSRPAAPIDANAARRMRELEIVAARMIREGFAGQYHSAFHGRGLEFSQVREYFPGDDVRSIDWNVTARSGAPHVKQFVEERDLALMLFLDSSRSMMFGSIERRKIEVALEVMSVLGFAAARNGDRVGLLTMGESHLHFLPPRRGEAVVRETIRTAMAVAAAERSAPLDIAAMVRGIERSSLRRGVIVLLSDLIESGDITPLLRLARRNDVIVIRISDPRERFIRGAGLVTVVDMETGAERLIDRRRASAGEAIRVSDDAVAALRSRGIDVLDLATTTPYDAALVSFFDARTRRRR